MSDTDSRTPSWARPAAAAADGAAGRILLAAFAAATVVDLGSLLAGWHLGHVIAKPLLMPLLVAHVVTRRAPGLLIAALLFGWGGDLALLFDAEPAFLVGMGSFAAGHVCYLVLFGRRGTHPALGGAYAVALLGTVALLWGDLPAGLRIPVAGYSLLLTAMAYRSSALGLRAGLGGALFLLSDTLIATGVADWPQLPRPDFWIMATYVAAQYLLATGALAPAQAYGRTVLQD
ncbi:MULTISPECIES: lysoplasmalogenase [unclassified Streptomyces]|uniref:lysoplasmalogenase n=1 Tax=unclassified Streptomyces TaxID=2593676 RepID=UPI002E1247C9|nr:MULTISPECIES: lysoplasmalogenase [unclassified Streptomyces]WSR25356.1 lysoplasmalogenase [Streptomyces sp. NBC_01205]